MLLVKASFCLKASHWIIESGRRFSKSTHALYAREPESCMELCLAVIVSKDLLLQALQLSDPTLTGSKLYWIPN